MFGNTLKLEVTGASHARKMTFRLANVPAGLRIDRTALAAFMERRAPGRDRLSTMRRESDEVVFRQGLDGDVADGSPIVGEIANSDIRPKDYGSERTVPRPGHADFGQWIEFGRIPTGGGKNSGRLTAPLCAAGGICLQYLAGRGVTVSACIESVGGETKNFESTIDAARRDGDSVGGTIVCTVRGLPPGIGGALFDGIESGLSAALFAIPGVKGVEFGDGFASASRRGSEYNDCFAVRDGRVVTTTNRQGGVMGGRTTGMPLVFRVAMRPTPTVFKPQPSVDLATMKPATCVMKGRHDPSIVRRAVPVVEAVAGFAFADALLSDLAARPRICLVLTGRTVEEDCAQFDRERLFTDMVEVRVDMLRPAERRGVLRLLDRVDVPAILTYRRKCDGGEFSGNDGVREKFFAKVLKEQRRIGRGFAYVDFEDDFRRSGLDTLAAEAGVRIIRSRHAFDGPVRNVARACAELVGKTDEIAKLAFMPKSLDDVARLFTQKPVSVPHVVLAMGPLGIASRVLAGKLGSLWCYASSGGLDGLGHVTPFRLVRDYRFRSMTRDAAVYGVTGWPLKATRSPELHNSFFTNEDEDAVMVPFPAASAAEAMRFMRALDMRGMAVTIPHKISVMRHLTDITRDAVRVGAVNTVTRRGSRLCGANTDVAGFREAFLSFVGDAAGKTAAVLGDGGAAQAVKEALRQCGVRFRVFHRETPPPGFDFIVNATPVDPIPDYVFTGRESVYDLRYLPEVTPLMARAAAAGCRVQNGFTMLQAQAREQQRIWNS